MLPCRRLDVEVDQYSTLRLVSKTCGSLLLRKWTLFTWILFLSGCAPTSLEDLRCQADAEMKGLLGELRRIETKEDLQKSAKRLKKYFYHIASLLVEARKFSNIESEAAPVGEELFAEFARIYEIPGAREAIELLQAEAVYVLRKKS